MVSLSLRSPKSSSWGSPTPMPEDAQLHASSSPPHVRYLRCPPWLWWRQGRLEIYCEPHSMPPAALRMDLYHVCLWIRIPYNHCTFCTTWRSVHITIAALLPILEMGASRTISLSYVSGLPMQHHRFSRLARTIHFQGGWFGLWC